MTRRTIATVGCLLSAAGLGCDGTLPSPAAITYIYADGVGNGEIVGADPRSGRTIALLAFPSGAAEVLGTLLFDGTTAYYADDSAGVPGATTDVSSIRSIGLAGGTPTTLVTGLDVVDGIAVDADSLYFVDYYKDAALDISSAVSFIGKAPRGGGSFVKLVDGVPGRLEGVAVSGGSLYWSSATDGTVNRISTAGGEPTVVATGQGTVYRLAADDSGVYWVNGGQAFVDCDLTDGSIESVPAGSSAAVTVVGGIDNLSSVVVSAGTVYFTMVGAQGCDSPSNLPPGGAVVEVPPGQSAGVPLATGLSSPFDLFVDDGVLDYTDTSAGYVRTPHTVSLGPTD
jgi:sugar lactone lactonase YvrE